MITLGATLYTSLNTTTNAAFRSIGTLRTVNGGGYLSSAFQDYLKEKGIGHELTVPHSPNRKVYQKNRFELWLSKHAR